MPNYRVRITRTLEFDTVVEAETGGEAIEVARLETEQQGQVVYEKCHIEEIS